MTHYPSEFQSGPGFDTVEPDVFFSLSPVLLAAVLLLLALAIVLTWFARDLFGRKDPDAANDIWTAINTACLLAMGANSDQLLARARALREEITARLGPVLTLADGLNKPLGALDKAIKGKIKDDRATAAAAGCTPHVTVLQNSQIVVKGEDCGNTAPATPPPASPPATDRDMTDVERAAALRSAIGSFHDHWSSKALRLAELRKARNALCHTAPVQQPAHH
mgnify:CR=1 FL=1|jgi:hypothetical protein|tara:strand:+ start:340 stop:1005 length:666 start_codon:yes stop_codon:yes gene_type:complete